MKQTICDLCGKPVGTDYRELQINEKLDVTTGNIVKSIYRENVLTCDLCNSCTTKLMKYLKKDK